MGGKNGPGPDRWGGEFFFVGEDRGEKGTGFGKNNWKDIFKAKKGGATGSMFWRDGKMCNTLVEMEGKKKGGGGRGRQSLNEKRKREKRTECRMRGDIFQQGD